MRLREEAKLLREIYEQLKSEENISDLSILDLIAAQIKNNSIDEEN